MSVKVNVSETRSKHTFPCIGLDEYGSVILFLSHNRCGTHPLNGFALQLGKNAPSYHRIGALLYWKTMTPINGGSITINNEIFGSDSNNSKDKWKYPCLVELTDGSIVLFNGFRVGTLLKPGKYRGDLYMGYDRNGYPDGRQPYWPWDYKLFNGSVTITNE
jgi:hypothetical protein